MSARATPATDTTRQAAAPRVSVVIPTYRREGVLVATLEALGRLSAPADEILVVDQTPQHAAETQARLEALEQRRQIRWLRLDRPSIPQAMNIGLREARGDVVLFLDDDIVPDEGLIQAHRQAHARGAADLVAGRVVQPWQLAATPEERAEGPFLTDVGGPRHEFMGGNFSLRRELALALGGFDENFVQVAYRYEAEFAQRLERAGGAIHYEPAASLRHLKAAAGGTRTYGEHLRTARPSHSVGAYYYALRSRPPGWWRVVLGRPWRSVLTRHHLRRPWWIPVTFLAEILGLGWACWLCLRGPRLLGEAKAGPSRG